MDRSIIHLNIADFAVSVESSLDGRLKDRPVIIAPQKTTRSTVYDMSEVAYRSGIRKGMMLRHAMRLCRDAWVLPPRPARYERAMVALFKQVLPYSPLIERGEADGHLFMDVSKTGRLWGPPMDVAWRLRKAIRTDLSMDPIWSVASNKLTAKVATRLVKPTGEYIVAPGEEQSFLRPVPLELIPGIEAGDLFRFHEFNLHFVSQALELNIDHLWAVFGKRAPLLYDAIRGIDMSPVMSAKAIQDRIAADHAFGDDTNDQKKMENTVYGLVEQVGARLRKRRMAARKISLRLDYSDGKRYIRQIRIHPPTADDRCLFESARKLLAIAWTRRVRVRYLRLICDRPVYPPAQLELFPPDREKKQRQDNLMAAIDTIRRRFGQGALQFGRAMA